jgi:uncharacterized protein YxjI
MIPNESFCPKCHTPVATGATDCLQCGINFVGYQHYLEHQHRPAIRHAEPRHAMTFAETKNGFLNSQNSVTVQQNEDMFRIVTGWQTRNRYVVLDQMGQSIAYIAERDTGILSTLSRQVLGPRRTLIVDVFNSSGEPIFQIKRPWFWFLSNLFVYSSTGRTIGSVLHRFTFFRPRYELKDAAESTFSYLESSILGANTLMDSIAGNRVFKSLSVQGDPNGGSISRIWKGLLNRALTAEDSYQIEFSPEWTEEQKLICLAASISIDLDFFDVDKGAMEKIKTFSPLGLLFGRSEDRDI